MSAAVWALDGTRDHPGLTIAVYRVTEAGRRIQVREAHRVPPADAAPFSLAYPPCECPQCLTSGGHR
ncbi:hypothetical protein GCM10009753_09570 [Streptantibioticus ferralitis]